MESLEGVQVGKQHLSEDDEHQSSFDSGFDSSDKTDEEGDNQTPLDQNENSMLKLVKENPVSQAFGAFTAFYNSNEL